MIYQMLFGKLPYSTKNKGNILELINVITNINLEFPSDTPITYQAKNLLK